MLVLLLFSIPPNNGFSIASNAVDFIGYSLTNNRKTAFFGHFFLSSPKMSEYNRFIFSGTLVHPNIFRLRLFRAFSDAWFAQIKFLTELNSPISGVQFSFATIFQCLIFVRFC